MLLTFVTVWVPFFYALGLLEPNRTTADLIFVGAALVWGITASVIIGVVLK